MAGVDWTREDGQVNSVAEVRGWVVAAVCRRVVGRLAACGVGERDREAVALPSAVPLVGGGSRRVEDDGG